MEFNVGDCVTRHSYNSDIIFKIIKIIDKEAVLRSYRLRLMADAPLTDLIKCEDEKKGNLKKKLLLESYEYLKRQQRNLILNGEKSSRNDSSHSFSERPGRVLHIDGDKDYLKMSMQNYDNLQIDAEGFCIPEKGQPEKLPEHLEKYNPDILVITGHDGVLNGESYRTSKYFAKAVKIARDYEHDLDKLVIFAGACQSSYKKLIENGANFASSIDGKLIHFMDPVLIVEKIAYTSIRKVLSVNEIINCTITEKTVGGIETRGKMRLCYP